MFSSGATSEVIQSFVDRLANYILPRTTDQPNKLNISSSAVHLRSDDSAYIHSILDLGLISPFIESPALLPALTNYYPGYESTSTLKTNIDVFVPRSKPRLDKARKSVRDLSAANPANPEPSVSSLAALGSHPRVALVKSSDYFHSPPQERSNASASVQKPSDSCVKASKTPIYKVVTTSFNEDGIDELGYSKTDIRELNQMIAMSIRAVKGMFAKDPIPGMEDYLTPKPTRVSSVKSNSEPEFEYTKPFETEFDPKMICLWPKETSFESLIAAFQACVPECSSFLPTQLASRRQPHMHFNASTFVKIIFGILLAAFVIDSFETCSKTSSDPESAPTSHTTSLVSSLPALSPLAFAIPPETSPPCPVSTHMPEFRTNYGNSTNSNGTKNDSGCSSQLKHPQQPGLSHSLLSALGKASNFVHLVAHAGRSWVGAAIQLAINILIVSGTSLFAS